MSGDWHNEGSVRISSLLIMSICHGVPPRTIAGDVDVVNVEVEGESLGR